MELKPQTSDCLIEGCEYVFVFTDGEYFYDGPEEVVRHLRDHHAIGKIEQLEMMSG